MQIGADVTLGAVIVGLALIVGLVLRRVLTNLENRQLYQVLVSAYLTQGQNLAHRVAELEWLRDVTRRVSSARTLNEVLDAAYDGIRTGLGYERIGINLWDYTAGIFEDCIGTDAVGQKTWPQERIFQLTADSPIWRFPGIATLLGGAEIYYTSDATAECPPELLYLYDGARPLHGHTNLMGERRGSPGPPGTA
jgi:hypothetical protein